MFILNTSKNLITSVIVVSSVASVVSLSVILMDLSCCICGSVIRVFEALKSCSVDMVGEVCISQMKGKGCD